MFRASTWANLRELIAFFKRDKLLLVFLVTAAALSTSAIISASFFVGNVLNRFVGALTDHSDQGSQMSLQELVSLCLAALATLGLYALQALVNSQILRWSCRLAYRSGSQIRLAVFTKLLTVPIPIIDRHPAGELMARMTSDIDMMVTNLVQFMFQAFLSPLQIIAALIAIFIVAPLLALIAVVIISIIFTITFTIAKHAAPNFNQMQDRIGELNAINEEFITNKLAIYTFAAQDYALKRFWSVNQLHMVQSYKAEYKIGMVYPAIDIMENISYGILYTIGFVFLMLELPSGGVWGFDFGLLGTFILLVRTANSELGNLARFASLAEKTLACLRRVFQITAAADDSDEGKITLGRLQGTIEFRNVHFAYDSQTPVLTNFNLTISPGQKVAIVGPTGSGKTTLINLLMRFYDFDTGTILIDGIDIKSITKTSLRQAMAVALQETALFSESILTNISYGHAGHLDRDQIIATAQKIGADHFIALLPNGWETIIREQTYISSGQAQLLALTRARYSPASLLILDEATSHVDSRTEAAVQRGMWALMDGKTSIIIAHRLSTIVEADLIVVLNHGQIVEQGTHQNLLARRGFYHELYLRQQQMRLDND